MKQVELGVAHKYAVNLRCSVPINQVNHITLHTLYYSTYFIHITMSDNPNPGNFANRPQEEVENIARKGGQSSHQGGFASMDPNKQVSKSVHYMTYYS